MLNYEFMEAISGKELKRKIHKFQEKYHINSVQYSTSPYVVTGFNSVWHCVMVEYEDKIV